METTGILQWCSMRKNLTYKNSLKKNEQIKKYENICQLKLHYLKKITFVY